MATFEEYKSYLKDRKLDEDTTVYNLTPTNVFDSFLMSSQLSEASAMGELEVILADVPAKVSEMLNEDTYHDPEIFSQMYAKMGAEDRKALVNAINKNETERVEDVMARAAATRAMEITDFAEAKTFIEKFKPELTKAQKLREEDNAKFLQITGGDYPSAMQLNDLHRKYRKALDEFNIKYLKHVADKIELTQVPGSTKYVSNGAAGPRDVRILDAEKQAAQIVGTTIKTEADALNYHAAKKQYLNQKYGFPLDYVPGNPTDEGAVEQQYPFVNAAFAAAFPLQSLSGVSGRLAAGTAGAVLESPLVTGMEAVNIQLSEANPVIRVGATVGTLLVAGVVGEAALSKLIQKGGATMAKPLNPLTYALKQAYDFDDILIDPKMYDGLFTTVTSPTKTQLKGSLIPQVTDEVGLEMVAPKPNSKLDNIIYIEGSEKTAETAQMALKVHEQSVLKQSTGKEFNKRVFSGYGSAIDQMLKEDNFEGAVKMWTKQVDDAYEMSNDIVDSTKFDLNVKPKFWNNSFMNMLPLKMKEQLIYTPNALVNVQNSVKQSFGKLVKSIDKDMSRKDKKLLNDVLKLEKEIDPVTMSMLPAEVREGYHRFRILNDYGYDSANKIMADQMNANNIRMYGDTKVQVLRNTDTGVEVRNLDNEDVFEVAAAELKEVTEAIPKIQNYYHRSNDSNDWVLSVFDKKKNKHKRVQVFKSVDEVHAVKKEMDQSGLETTIHRVHQNPDLVRKGAKYTNISAHEEMLSEVATDLDEAMQILADAGISKHDSIDVVDEVISKLAEAYGIKDKQRLFKGLTGARKISGRTREVALNHIKDYQDSLSAWSDVVSRLATERNYLDKLKSTFKQTFGDRLDNPNDVYSKVRQLPDDITGDISKAGKLVQSQIKNIERIPDSTTLKIRQVIDNNIHKMYTSDIGQLKFVGRAIDTLNTKMPFAPTAKGLGYTSKLMFNMAQIPQQASFSMFGLLSHGDLFAKNSKLMGEVVNDLRVVSTALLSKRMGKTKHFFKLSPKHRAMVDEIEDMGYMSDLIGTELGYSDGLLKGFQRVAMAPVTIGESANRLTNIMVAFKVAEKEGLKWGTKEHRRFVSQYYPKYSQVLNHLTNSPLTSSSVTSWNVGMFMKFQTQWVSQFYSNLSWKQQMGAGAAAYGLFGKYGFPLASEVAATANIVNDKLYPMYVQSVLNTVTSTSEMTESELIEYIKTKGLDPDDEVKEIEAIKKAIPERDRIMKELSNKRLGDYLEGENKTVGEMLYHAVLGVLNHEGLFENVAMNIGWRSKIDQIRDFGGESLFGPFIDTIRKLDLSGTTYRLSQSLGLTDEYGWGQLNEQAKGEMNRMIKAISPQVSKSIEAGNRFDDVFNAINQEELYDENGKLVTWARVFDNPDIVVKVPYETQATNKLGKKVLSDTMTLRDIGWSILGVDGEEIKNKKKFERLFVQHYMRIIDPQIKALSQFYDYQMSKGNAEVANRAMVTTMLTWEKNYGPTITADLKRKLLKETSNTEYRRTKVIKNWTYQMSQEDLEALTERFKR